MLKIFLIFEPSAFLAVKKLENEVHLFNIMQIHVKLQLQVQEVQQGLHPVKMGGRLLKRPLVHKAKHTFSLLLKKILFKNVLFQKSQSNYLYNFTTFSASKLSVESKCSVSKKDFVV